MSKKKVVEKKKKIVLCIEGAHGVGKSTICQKFKSKNYPVMSENFMNNTNGKKNELHPQHLLNETNWIVEYFNEVLKFSKKHSVFLTDRSPFTASVYSKKKGETLKPFILSMMEMLEEEKRIHFIVINLKDKTDIIWKRVLKRLKKEPERKIYNEHKKDWLVKVIKRYSVIWGLNFDYTFEKDHYDSIKRLFHIVSSSINTQKVIPNNENVNK